MASGSSDKRSLPKMATQKAWKSEFDFLQFSSKDMFCKVCLRFDDEIKSCKNYHPTFINGCGHVQKKLA